MIDTKNVYLDTEFLIRLISSGYQKYSGQFLEPDYKLTRGKDRKCRTKYRVWGEADIDFIIHRGCEVLQNKPLGNIKTVGTIDRQS